MAFTPDKVHVGHAHSLYYVNRHSYVERLISEGGFEEKRAVYLNGLLKPDDVFVDIGANVGFFTVLAARLAAEVHSFEPEPINQRRLKRNIRLNKFSEDRVVIHECALGATNGVIKLNRPLSDNYGRASVKELQAADAVTVKLLKLDDVLKPSRKRHVIKIDVEGAELDVLAGAEIFMSSLASGSVCLVEVHTGCGVDIGVVADYFSKHGYKVEYFDDETGRISSQSSVGTDVLLVAERR